MQIKETQQTINITHENMSYALKWFYLGCSSAHLGSLPCPTWQTFNSVNIKTLDRPRSRTRNSVDTREHSLTPLTLMKWIKHANTTQTKRCSQRNADKRCTYIPSELLEDFAELSLLVTLVLLCILHRHTWWRLWDRGTSITKYDPLESARQWIL